MMFHVHLAVSILYLPWKISQEEKQDNILETSNGRKIARTAPISTIFGSIESRRCQLNLKKKSVWIIRIFVFLKDYLIHQSDFLCIV